MVAVRPDSPVFSYLRNIIISAHGTHVRGEQIAKIRAAAHHRVDSIASSVGRRVRRHWLSKRGQPGPFFPSASAIGRLIATLLAREFNRGKTRCALVNDTHALSCRPHVCDREKGDRRRQQQRAENGQFAQLL